MADREETGSLSSRLLAKAQKLVSDFGKDAKINAAFLDKHAEDELDMTNSFVSKIVKKFIHVECDCQDVEDEDLEVVRDVIESVVKLGLAAYKMMRINQLFTEETAQ